MVERFRATLLAEVCRSVGPNEAVRAQLDAYVRGVIHENQLQEAAGVKIVTFFSLPPSQAFADFFFQSDFIPGGGGSANIGRGCAGN